MVSKKIRIVRYRGRFFYEVRLPIPGSGMIYGGDEIQLMKGVAEVMNSTDSLEDSREYGVWYGPNLGLSDEFRRGLEAIVRLRNKVVGN